ncbi:Blue (Type 1) copper domain protein [Paraburkholderia ribeironis]|uniref:Blue (Type 1) copper domain protein n=1 Tax=Paraburkholderia ribeironis TaxID=1247936 RepID=A0A1N7SIY0_9BURK|nr:cupredoxin family copper-binding protein [Paraburkholderia ribeironis]SIT47362.1 Blue (Type 1) copper domain protein [Paraburkholderia ribeironis]
MQTKLTGRALAALFGSSMLIAALAGPGAAYAQTPNVVTIKNFMFSPMELTIKAGSTVTWKNLDGEPHTVVNDAGMFRSAALDQNDTYQFKFDKPGVYKVFCAIHPNMRETITVQ